jgi:hypothetical protein
LRENYATINIIRPFNTLQQAEANASGQSCSFVQRGAQLTDPNTTMSASDDSFGGDPPPLGSADMVGILSVGERFC